MKKSLCVLVVALALSPITSRAQVVVTNPTSLVQLVSELSTLKSQLTQQEQQYQALTGSTGIGNLLSGDTSLLKQNLPSNWTTVYGDALNSGSSGYNSRSTEIVNAIKSKVDGMGRTDALDYATQQDEQKGATDRAMGEQAYDNEMAELNNIQSLTDQIDSTTTPKEIADLQARVATAQGSIQAEQTKLNLMASLQKSQDKINQQQQAEAVRRYTIGNADDDFTAPNITSGN